MSSGSSDRISPTIDVHTAASADNIKLAAFSHRHASRESVSNPEGLFTNEQNEEGDERTS